MPDHLKLEEGDTIVVNGVTYTVQEDVEVIAEAVDPSPIPNQGSPDSGT